MRGSDKKKLALNQRMRSISDNFSATNLTWTGLESNSDFCGERENLVHTAQ